MKKYLLYLILFVSMFTNAQVGVNTTAPRSSLDVQGSMMIRGNIRTAGTNLIKGQTGRLSSLLVSNGPNQIPEWKSLKIPSVKSGRYYMLFADSFSDRVGIDPVTSSTASNPFAYGSSLNTNWTVIPGLTKSFTVQNTSNKLFILYEAVAQINSTAQYQGVDFTCGVFVDNTLIGARTIDLYQATSAGNNIFRTFTILATNKSNLTTGNHEVKIACTRRANYGGFAGNFSVGKQAGSASNVDVFMSQSSLRVEVFEVPTSFLNIVN